MRNSHVHQRTLVALILLFTWVCHMVACMWHAIGFHEAIFEGKTTWLVADKTLDDSISVRYVRAMYFAFQV
jgi:hypothetical protein